ncbi:MAG: gamma-glutamyltransferase [Armatimonadetes bacterium]|nr:gamma-glutamyltransferase [Armatimonadota bacterium]
MASGAEAGGALPGAADGFAWGTPGGPHGGAYRPVAMGKRGMVATGHPLGTAAGLRVLMDGGNALDAAVAAAAVLSVVEPYESGVGGGGYLLFYDARASALHCLDYVGRSPRAMVPTQFATQDDLYRGPRGALVPAAAAGWLAALDRFGSMDRGRVLAAAVTCADDGFPLTIRNAGVIREYASLLAGDGRVARVFLPHGRPPRAGAVIRQADLAAMLRLMAEGGLEAFYRGPIAAEIARYCEESGGLLTSADLAACRVQWVEPIRGGYRDWTVALPPPPCSGFQILETLRIIEGDDLRSLGRFSAACLHLLIETMKLAIADRIAHAAVPAPPLEVLLSAEYAARQRRRIDPDRAALSEGERYARVPGKVQPGLPSIRERHTTHLDVVDRWGNIASVTQSVGDFFGAGVVAGNTGILLNNLAYWFDLNPDSPNAIGPGKGIEMPMSPCIVFRNDRPVLALGTPGGHGILETTVQILINLLDLGMNIQAAIEAPRFRTQEGRRVVMESRIPPEVRDALATLGHEIEPAGEWAAASFSLGRAQGIWIEPGSGTLMGGADPRTDGTALGW